MKNILTLLSLILIFFSCQKKKESTPPFVFDASQISNKEIHVYDFLPNGKIKSEKIIHFLCEGGVPFDSSVVINEYHYNDKGKINQIDDLTDSIRQVKVYDPRDSLAAEYAITERGDTTYRSEMTFENGKIKRWITRILNYNYNQGQDPLANGAIFRFDTLFESREYSYVNDLLKNVTITGRGGNNTSEIEYTYDGKTMTKSNLFSYDGPTRRLKEETHYYPNETTEPDAYVLGPHGDTLSFKKIFKQDNGRRVLNHFSEAQTSEVHYYNEKGLLTGSMITNLQDKSKFVYRYQYDDAGNKLEESYYLTKADTLQ